jgi:hypothetical protein
MSMMRASVVRGFLGSEPPAGPHDGHETQYRERRVRSLWNHGNVPGDADDEIPDDRVRRDEARKVLRPPAGRIRRSARNAKGATPNATQPPPTCRALRTV